MAPLTRDAQYRALQMVRIAHDVYRRFGMPRVTDPNLVVAHAAAYIASGRWPHSSADVRGPYGCYCDWCAAKREAVA
jgi:hypothetical protein